MFIRRARSRVVVAWVKEIHACLGFGPITSGYGRVGESTSRIIANAKRVAFFIYHFAVNEQTPSNAAGGGNGWVVGLMQVGG